MHPPVRRIVRRSRPARREIDLAEELSEGVLAMRVLTALLSVIAVHEPFWVGETRAVLLRLPRDDASEAAHMEAAVELLDRIMGRPADG